MGRRKGRGSNVRNCQCNEGPITSKARHAHRAVPGDSDTNKPALRHACHRDTDRNTNYSVEFHRGNIHMEWHPISIATAAELLPHLASTPLPRYQQRHKGTGVCKGGEGGVARQALGGASQEGRTVERGVGQDSAVSPPATAPL